MNQALVGYLQNGQIRTIVIRNKEGVILARALYRLYWDSTHHKPILYKDRFYGDPKLKKLIDAMCWRRKEVLKLEMVGETGLDPYKGKIASLEGRCPIDYSEPYRDVVTGPYEVIGSYTSIEPAVKLHVH